VRLTQRRLQLLDLVSSRRTCGFEPGRPPSAFWSRMQVELLNTRRWKTRVELANAIFEYIEVFHNRRRRHSALGMRTPIEYELINTTITPAAA
jgi:transposase InsO family protein